MWCRLLSLVCTAALIACGSGNGGTDGPPGGDDGNGVDGSGTPDAIAPVDCTPGATECTDCMDNDHDGRTDGYDPECTGAADDDESSFATGIPGDNIDTVKQDCFFDGNSGSGDDGCEIHVCCLLGAPDRDSCPFGGHQYNPADCSDPQAQTCLDSCLGLVPPGCDCFGCCTICNDVDCYDVVTNPATAPDCDPTVLGDPTMCPPCNKVSSCEVPCDNEMCVLCPGQDPSDLPAGCTSTTCPNGLQECITQACPSGTFCANGCCVDDIIE